MPLLERYDDDRRLSGEHLGMSEGPMTADSCGWRKGLPLAHDGNFTQSQCQLRSIFALRRFAGFSTFALAPRNCQLKKVSRSEIKI
jgi:hypothetical protein